MVYKRTRTKFIADDKVLCQGVRRATRLASDNSWADVVCSVWAGDRGEYCVHLHAECQFHAKSRRLRGEFWLVLLTQHEVLHLLNVIIATCRTRSAAAWLAHSCTRHTDSLQQTMLPSFQLLSGNLLNNLRAPYPYDW